MQQKPSEQISEEQTHLREVKSFKSYTFGMETDNGDIKLFKFISHGDLLLFYMSTLRNYLFKNGIAPEKITDYLGGAAFEKDGVFFIDTFQSFTDKEKALEANHQDFINKVRASDDKCFSAVRTFCEKNPVIGANSELEKRKIHIVVVADGNLSTPNGHALTYYVSEMNDRAKEINKYGDCKVNYYGFSGGDEPLVNSLKEKGAEFNKKKDTHVAFEFIENSGKFNTYLPNLLKDVKHINTFPITPLGMHPNSAYSKLGYAIEEGVLKYQKRKGDIDPSPNYSLADLDQVDTNTQEAIAQSALPKFNTAINLQSLRSDSVEENLLLKYKKESLIKEQDLGQIPPLTRWQSMGDNDPPPSYSPEDSKRALADDNNKIVDPLDSKFASLGNIPKEGVKQNSHTGLHRLSIFAPSGKTNNTFGKNLDEVNQTKNKDNNKAPAEFRDPNVKDEQGQQKGSAYKM